MNIEEYETETFNEPFQIENDEQANWAMRKYAGIVKQMRTNNDLAQKEHARIDAWLESVTTPLSRQAEYFFGLMQSYMQRERDRRKSIRLIDGTIKSRVTPNKVEIDDEFIDWAAGERDDLIVYQPPKPNMLELRRLLQAGEQIPHTKLVEGGVSFSIEVNDER